MYENRYIRKTKTVKKKNNLNQAINISPTMSEYDCGLKIITMYVFHSRLLEYELDEIQP